MFSKINLLILLLSFSLQILAAGESDFPHNYYNIVIVILMFIIIIALLSIIYFEGKKKKSETKSHNKFNTIKNLTSKIPSWVFKLVYLIVLMTVVLYFYDFGTSESKKDNGNSEDSSLNKDDSSINEETVTLKTDSISLKSGKYIYDSNCIACHLGDGGGSVGPNFTDEYWIYGGGIKNIFKSIKYGVPEKGMISWQTVLNPKQMQEVASYILSFQGTTPAAPKQPEGEIWKGEKK